MSGYKEALTLYAFQRVYVTVFVSVYVSLDEILKEKHLLNGAILNLLAIFVQYPIDQRQGDKISKQAMFIDMVAYKSIFCIMLFYGD